MTCFALVDLKRCERCGELCTTCCSQCEPKGDRKHRLTCSRHVSIRPSAESGLGVFARHAFEMGCALICERPLAVVTGDFVAHSRQARDACEREVASLTTARRAVIMDLTDVHGSARSSWGVFATNAIPIANGVALFALTCRINHSCRPNARYTWRADLGCELVSTMPPGKLAAMSRTGLGQEGPRGGRFSGRAEKYVKVRAA